jgi:hypothetical protein
VQNLFDVRLLRHAVQPRGFPHDLERLPASAHSDALFMPNRASAPCSKVAVWASSRPVTSPSTGCASRRGIRVVVSSGVHDSARLVRTDHENVRVRSMRAMPASIASSGLHRNRASMGNCFGPDRS